MAAARLPPSSEPAKVQLRALWDIPYRIHDGPALLVIPRAPLAASPILLTGYLIRIKADFDKGIQDFIVKKRRRK